jgi:hypothetical protein
VSREYQPIQGAEIMRKIVAGVAAVVILSFTSMAGVASAESPSCNWGELTSGAVQAGFPQGPHSSDPSGDGHGTGTADEPRAGLGNVVSLGDLNATCELISSSLP